jgi:hypothetical protein
VRLLPVFAAGQRDTLIVRIEDSNIRGRVSGGRMRGMAAAVLLGIAHRSSRFSIALLIRYLDRLNPFRHGVAGVLRGYASVF